MSKIIFNFICWLVNFLNIEHALSLIEYLNLKYKYESVFMEKPDQTQDELEKQIQQEYENKLKEESRQELIDFVMHKRQAYNEAKKARELAKQDFLQRNYGQLLGIDPNNQYYSADKAVEDAEKEIKELEKLEKTALQRYHWASYASELKERYDFI